jgi:long-chain acyl-CoA synthetase
VTIYEGYGMTETSPVISFNYMGAFKAGTTGKLLPYVQLKFSPEGELLVKGPNVTSGYYNNTEATSEAIEADGWLHTGDLGMWDEHHYLKITGRIKELIVLCTGKKVAPIPIENKLKQNPMISQAVVLGNDRKFITALIFPNEAEVRTFARIKGVVAEDIGEIYRHEDIKKEFSDIVKRVNDEFSQYEQAKCFEIIPYNIDSDSEMMTPTLKVRRRVIENKFRDVIDKMYE